VSIPGLLVHPWESTIQPDRRLNASRRHSKPAANWFPRPGARCLVAQETQQARRADHRGRDFAGKEVPTRRGLSSREELDCHRSRGRSGSQDRPHQKTAGSQGAGGGREPYRQEEERRSARVRADKTTEILVAYDGRQPPSLGMGKPRLWRIKACADQNGPPTGDQRRVGKRGCGK